jgi:ATP-dependent RNA helicase DDX42
MSGNKQKGFGFGGFAIKPKGTSVETQLAQMGYGLPGMAGRSHASILHIGKKRVRNEDEYFEDDDDDQRNVTELEYQPAPGSPTLDRLNAHGKKKDSSDSDSDSSEDPLESFMADIEKEVKQQDIKEKGVAPEEPDAKGKRDDIEEEDDQESYFRYMEENPTAGLINDEEDNVDYDEDGNPIMPDKKIIDPLPPIDHTQIKYAEFTKNFYEEHPEIAAVTPDHMIELRRKLGIHVSGILAPKPVSSFAHFGFDDRLMKAIRKAGYTQPTPIQAQGVPIALSGRDIIGIAKTGSGKTAAYLWPLLIHIMDQKELQPGDGPIGLICAPTRELSQQIYQEAKKFGKIYNINVVCAYGGGNLYEQCKACEEGAEIIVATPGRLIDLVRKKATDLSRVTYLVFDEADRMFDLGFEPQVRSIADHVRPDRQTLMFSATFRKRVERVARDILTDPLRVVQGDAGEANEDVTQIVKVMYTDQAKWTWLLSNLVQFTTVGSVLIFVTRKANCEEVANNLRHNDFEVGLLHGDMSQVERNEVINSFRHKVMPILVATDVAARGLDIPHIRTVVNFDVARDIDTHTHRIGRTGRAGEKGTAFTLVTTKDRDFAGHLVRNLEGANQYVPQELMDIAMQNAWFKKNRFQQQKAKKLNTGGSGLGFRERPGLGAKNSTSTNSSSLPSYAMSGSKGPQSDRVAAMKAAFAAQFKVNFVTAASHAPNDAANWTTSATMDVIPVSHSEQQAQQQAASSSSQSTKRRKTRWND